MSVTIERALLILLSIGQTVWMLSWVIGRWTQRQEISNVELGRRLTALELKPDGVLLERDIKAAHVRMDRAGQQMSEMATDMQGFETRMRAVFVTRELAEEWLRESRGDRRQLWDAIEKLHKNRGRV